MRRFRHLTAVGLWLSLLTLGSSDALGQAVDDGVWRLDTEAPLTYFIATGSSSSGYLSGDRELAEWALRAWASRAPVPFALQEAAEDEATIRIYWVEAGAGLYGEMRGRVVEGRRGADLFVRPDANGLGPDIASAAVEDPLFRDTVVYLTCVHELGHAFGLPHTRAYADIMYSFQYGGDFVAYFRRFREQLEERVDIPDASPFSSTDLETLHALYR